MDEQELKEETINRRVDYLVLLQGMNWDHKEDYRRLLESVWHIAFTAGRLAILKEVMQ